MPRVSVIIPAYNSEGEIGEALRSVQAQTYGDWEAFVSDDASTDRTADIAEEFGGKVRVLRGDQNRGTAAARNAAVAAASGELLAFLDSDDYWLPEYLDEQIALYDSAEAARTGVGVVASDALVLHPGGFAAATYRSRVRFPEPLTVARLLAGNPIFVSGALATRRAVEGAGGFEPACGGTADHDLWLRVLELGHRIVPNPAALAVYRLRDTSIAADSRQMARDAQTVQRRALARGGLGRREQRIAKRELRLSRLVEDVWRARLERASGVRSRYLDLVRTAPRLVWVAIENPQRWGRVARRLRGGRGGVIRSREAVLR